MVVKPFDVDRRFTRFSNLVIDHVMPRVLPAAWKVLTVVWRQTEGWAEDKKTRKRKEWDEISYSQFMERSGIGSSGTIRRALERLLTGGCPIRTVWI